MVSGYHDLTDSVAIMGNVVWQQWSEFGKPNLEVDFDDQPQGHRQPQLRRHLGLRPRHAATSSRRTGQWSVGVAFDTSPISKKERTPALPLDQQIRVGTGVQYALNDRVTIGTAYEYLNLGEADISRSRPLAGTLQGNYSTNEIHFFNATLSWKF